MLIFYVNFNTGPFYQPLFRFREISFAFGYPKVVPQTYASHENYPVVRHTEIANGGHSKRVGCGRVGLKEKATEQRKMLRAQRLEKVMRSFHCTVCFIFSSAFLVMKSFFSRGKRLPDVYVAEEHADRRATVAS